MEYPNVTVKGFGNIDLARELCIPLKEVVNRASTAIRPILISPGSAVFVGRPLARTPVGHRPDRRHQSRSCSRRLNSEGTTALTHELTTEESSAVEAELADTWQAASARHHFSELIEAAVSGRPQFIRRRDGREVVLVSKEYYSRTKPTLKSVLLSHRFGERGDVLDQALEDAKVALGAALTPQAPEQVVDRPGHKRRQ
jgi:prevent-host-death family protein